MLVLIAFAVAFGIVKRQYRKQDGYELQNAALEINSFAGTVTPALSPIEIAMEENHSQIDNTSMETQVEEEHSPTSDVEIIAVDENLNQSEVIAVAVGRDQSQTETVAVEIIDAEENHRQTEMSVEVMAVEEDHSQTETTAVENNQTQNESGNRSEAFSIPQLESAIQSPHTRPVLLVPSASSQLLALPQSATLPLMQSTVLPSQFEEDTTLLSPQPDEGISPQPQLEEDTTLLPLQPEGIVPPAPQPEMGSAPSKGTITLSLSKRKSRPTDDLEELLLDSEPSSSLRTESAVDNDADTIDNVNTSLVQNRQK